MRLLTPFIGYFTLLAAPVLAQDTSVNYANTITATDLKKHLEVLASDEYEGRETGKEGQKKAAAYIATQFKNLGLPPVVNNSYFQNIPLTQSEWGSRLLVANQKEFKFMEDFYAFPDLKDTKVYTNEIVFAGYGINDSVYNDYAGISIANKAVIIASGEPVNKKGISYITKTDKKSDWATNSAFKKIEAARQLKPALILYIDKDITTTITRYRHYLADPTLVLKEEKNDKPSIPVVFISQAIADSLLSPNKSSVEKALAKINSNGKPKPLTLSSTVGVKLARVESTVNAENVLGYLKGTDLADELVVITAHYDHIGVIDNKVYNGADDDGSGTVAVLELAEAFTQAAKEGKGPRRSMLFMTVSGEEKGLLGSEYYTNNPVFPLDKTITNLNIDMIGRVDEKHKDSSNYVYVIGSDKLSTTLHKINEEANSTFTKLSLDYTFNDPKDPNRFYYRSDHYNFAKNNIPIIFYFNGVHEDYHKETDEISKINFDIMAQRTKLVFHTAWNLANRNERPVVDVTNDFKDK